MPMPAKRSDFRRTSKAPMEPTPEAPGSMLAETSTYEREVEVLQQLAERVVDLNDIEMRIGLMARIVLEAALRNRDGRLTLKEKADIALRAITTLEGTKQEVTWRADLLTKPVHKNTEVLAAERAEVEKRLMAILTRKKEVQLAAAEDALKQVEATPALPAPPTEVEN